MDLDLFSSASEPLRKQREEEEKEDGEEEEEEEEVLVKRGRKWRRRRAEQLKNAIRGCRSTDTHTLSFFSLCSTPTSVRVSLSMAEKCALFIMQLCCSAGRGRLLVGRAVYD